MHPQSHIPNHAALSTMVQHRPSDERHHHFIESNFGGPGSSGASNPGLRNMASKIEDTPPPIRKKGGRGPGKRDSKEKPAISVRWEEADLTDRLITALEMHDRWSGVFTSTASAEHSRSLIGVPKRDLQREIARYLFRDDPRYDLEDKRTVEALAVSVKNKLFKIQTLFIECKGELGAAYNSLTDERDIPPDSDLSHVWARIKDKLPQFFRVRDIMNRPVALIQADSSPSMVESSSVGQMGESSFRTTMMRTPSTPFSLDTSGIAYASSPLLSPGGRPQSTIPQQPLQQYHQRYYPPPLPPPLSRASFPSPYALESGAPDESGPSPHQNLLPLRHAPSVPEPFDTRFPPGPASFAAESPSPRYSSPSTGSPPAPPSPPLSQTMLSLFQSLDSRKRRREEEFVSLKRLKLEQRERDKQREERERERWHEREVLRLKIQLENLKRSAAEEDEASGNPGTSAENGFERDEGDLHHRHSHHLHVHHSHTGDDGLGGVEQGAMDALSSLREGSSGLRT